MKKIVVLAAAATTLTAATPVLAASLNDDINNCRAAIVEAELFGDAEFNVNFVKDHGNRNRVLTLEAKVVGGEDAVVECRMSRSKIKEVAIVEAE
ncbi:MAG: hypothetical protein V2I43_29500 [Parvularcula sp.]|nr:hypothetical protein [Parvularcula sp.]